MRRGRLALVAMIALLSGLWLLADPGALSPASFIALRNALVQYSGLLAMAAMSLAMILALRPRWLEPWLGGLDKMYRLHKWLGIGGLALSIVHWLWSKGPKWAVALGWMERPQRTAGAEAAGVIEQALRAQRGTAESLGEWAFYGAVLLIAAALVHRIPYRIFYRTHRLLAVLYLVLVLHSIVLMQFSYWTSPLGPPMAALLAYGSLAAALVLLRRVGADRKVEGRITRLHHYPPLRVLEGEIDIPEGWPGHRAGQFAFVTSDRSEGAHPYTIASAWDPAAHRMTFIVKALGDHTGRLAEALRVGAPVQIEGPYGGFTFEDDCRRQIWVGAGIGITPFIARMKYLAGARTAGREPLPGQAVDLFHTTADYSEEAIARLRADATAAGIRLHVLHDARDGLLTGDRVRAAVPDWRDASIWFCGPAGFGDALSRDFARQGLPVARRFHRELFALR